MVLQQQNGVKQLSVDREEPLTVPMSTVIPRVSKSLQKLRDAARSCFVTDGFHNTRPQDIAKKAGVASGTFYLHFVDKKSAFLDFAEQAQNELIEINGRNLVGLHDSSARWRRIFQTLVEFGRDNPGLLQAAFLDPVLIAPNDEKAWLLYDRVGLLVEVALKEDREGSRALSDEYDLTLISHAICGALRHAMTYAVRKDIDPETMIENLSRFVDHGLSLGQGNFSNDRIA